MSSIDPQGFPLDLTGELPRNLVINDTRTLAAQDDMIFVPDGGPFFTRTLVVRSGTSILKPNIDYKCLHLLKDATVESGLDVSAVIMITNTTISEITLSYQVIGGTYGDTVPVIRQLLVNADNIEKSINWNTHIYAKPDVFEPAPHFVKGEDFSDWSSVLNGLQAIERSILLKDVAAWESAFQYIDNLITVRVAGIDLTNFYTQTQVNAETVKLALKTSVYTKIESDAKYYSKTEVHALIGDIDGNETYYTEAETNAKFIETTVADAKYATSAELNRVDSAKSDISTIYTRTQSDDKYALKINVYNKDYIDTTFVIKGTSYTKAETEARYALITDAYNKVDSDKRYALKSQIPQAADLSSFITRTDADGAYLKLTTADVIYLRKTTADSLYAKHTDLYVIDTLTKKFLEYYTKIESDALYITNVNVNSLFLTKVQGSSLYYSKTFVATTYATKIELADADVRINANLNLKAPTDWVNLNFYNKVDSDKRYYTQTDSNIRYYTKQHLDTYFVTNTELTRQVGLLTTLAKFDAKMVTVDKGIADRYSKVESDARYYTGSYVSDNFVSVPLFNSNNSVINTTLTKKSDTTWVNTTFYDKAEADIRYYTKSTIDSLFYTKLASDALYQTKSAFNLEIAKYQTAAAHVVDMASIDVSLNNKYNKNETYSISESNARYIPITTSILDLNFNSTNMYSGGASINNTHATATTGGTLLWKLRGDNIAMLQPSINTALNTSRLTTYLFDATTRIWSSHAIVGTEGMWHRAYGWIHDYFAVRGNTYTKAETYSKAEVDAKYYSKSQSDEGFVSLTQHNRDINAIDATLSTKSDVVWITNNFFSKADSDVRYYTKTEIVASYYNKSQSDTMYATKTALTAEVNKLVTSLTHNADITFVKGMFAAYYTKVDIDRSYATIANLNLKSDVTWITNNYTTTINSDVRYYTKTLANATFAPKIDTDNRLVTLTAQYINLLSRIEAYKVGDIFTTTTTFTSGSAVAVHHGYGTWERFAQGRTLVGKTINGHVDDITRTEGLDYYYYVGTSTIGNLFGTYKHKLTVEEMAAHTHQLGFRLRTQVDVDWGGGDRGVDQVDSPTASTGGDMPHANVQPSVVVGYWKRIL